MAKNKQPDERREGLNKLYNKVLVCMVCRKPYGTNIKKDDPIPDDISTMVLFVDMPLNDRQRFEIDKLIHKGVKIIMAAQSYNFQITPSRGGEVGTFDVQAMPTRVNLNAITKSYGFEIDNKVFMDRSAAFIQVPAFRTRKMGIFQIQEQCFKI